MTDTYTVKDVTSDLRYLLTLTNFFEADAEGFWMLPESDKRYKHKLDKLDPGDEGREIVLFQDPAPRGDYLFFNPFSEGLGKQNPATIFFWKTMRIAINQTIMLTMFHVARMILSSKEASAKKEEFSISSTVIRMSSVLLGKRQSIHDVIDEEMITEFKKLFSRIEDTVIHVNYYDKQMTAKIMCHPLTDPDWDEKYGKDIRKKSISAFKALLMGVLGISRPEELDTFNVKYDPSLKSAPRLHAQMLVYFKLYSAFNDATADAYAVEGKSVDKFVVDMTHLHAVIERFPLAYAIAKHMIQPAVSSVKPTGVDTSDTSRLRFSQPSAGQGDAPARRFNPPPATDIHGRPIQQQSLRFDNAGSSASGGGRFKPHIVESAPRDPFSPVIPSTAPSGFGMGQSTGFGGSSFGGGFGGSGQLSFANNGFGTGFGNDQGWSASPPSNFGQPGTRRW